MSVQCHTLRNKRGRDAFYSTAAPDMERLLSFIAEVTSVRTNLSPFSKGYRGFASLMQFDPIYARRAPLTKGTLITTTKRHDFVLIGLSIRRRCAAHFGQAPRWRRDAASISGP